MKNAKTYIIIAVVIVVCIVLYIVGRKIYNSIMDKSKSLVNKAGDTINKNKLSYTPTEYASMADAIYQAMIGAGTRETTLGQVLSKLKNEDDWKALIQAFGVRGTPAWYSTDINGNLVEWLESELDSQERTDLSAGLATIGVIF